MKTIFRIFTVIVTVSVVLLSYITYTQNKFENDSIAPKFDKKEILDVLSKIQGLTGRKTNLTITSDILIKAMGSQITITANDLETVFFGYV